MRGFLFPPQRHSPSAPRLLGPTRLLDQRPLEFSHGADDLKHQSAGRRTEVQVVPKTDEGHTERCEFGTASGSNWTRKMASSIAIEAPAQNGLIGLAESIAMSKHITSLLAGETSCDNRSYSATPGRSSPQFNRQNSSPQPEAKTPPSSLLKQPVKRQTIFPGAPRQKAGKVGQPKSKASQAPVPMHLLLAEFMRAWQIRTPYPQPEDWVFPSLRLDGRKPRAANMLVEDYLRPAAVKAGVIAADDPCRFGFHNLRHSLASFLVRSKTDPKTVQALLRHSDVKTTLQLYAHSVSADRMTAQGEVLQAILGGATPANSGLNAD